MIKLKQLLNEAKGLLKEITDRNFNFDQLRKNNKKAAKVKAALAKAGVKIDIRKPINQMKYVEGHAKFEGKMFKHMQYRYIKGKDGKTYFIHETQHWLNDIPNVDITEIQVSEAPNYYENLERGHLQLGSGEKPIGNAIVLTKDFLKAIKKVETIKRG